MRRSWRACDFGPGIAVTTSRRGETGSEDDADRFSSSVSDMIVRVYARPSRRPGGSRAAAPSIGGVRIEHQYRIGVQWTGNRGEGTSGYKAYGRESLVTAEGKPPLECSSDRAFRGDADRWNPEDLLVAALSQCHMLSYLHAAV